MWARGYTFGTSESHPHAGVQLADGGLVVVGDGQDYSKRTALKRAVMVLRTAPGNGSAVWQRSFGTAGYNYGKWAIEQGDGSLVVATAMTAEDGSLRRVLLRLNGGDGSEMERLVLPNAGSARGLRDGFMCVEPGEKEGVVVATGFVGGESSASGYPDEPMFLIGGGRPFFARIAVPPRRTGMALLQEVPLVAPAHAGFAAVQGMRLLRLEGEGGFVVSHTVTMDGGGGMFQFGLSAVGADGKVKWMRSYPAAAGGGLSGHASHPYALTHASGADSPVAIAGLAVLSDARGIDRCQGRLLTVNATTGDAQFDARFNATIPDANVECYGVTPAPGGGFVVACGTGVEPELHPHDPAVLKTWRALAHRADSGGRQLWSKAYTDAIGLKNNAAENIISLRGGGYALLVDSQTYGSAETGGNFAVLRLGSE